jgi:hypothetical protein
MGRAKCVNRAGLGAGTEGRRARLATAAQPGETPSDSQRRPAPQRSGRPGRATPPRWRLIHAGVASHHPVGSHRAEERATRPDASRCVVTTSGISDPLPMSRCSSIHRCPGGRFRLIWREPLPSTARRGQVRKGRS